LDLNKGFISRTVTEQLETRLSLSNFSLAHGFPLSIQREHDGGSFIDGLT